MQEAELKKLERTASIIRQDIIKMLFGAGSGHSAGSLGMADVFTVLYFGNVLKYNPKKPNWDQRDVVVLSNGHICPVLYATLARAGFFSAKKLSTLRKLNSGLQGHPHRGSLPGIESSGGPVAHNTSVAAGMAYSFKMDNKKNKVFCITGDGGHEEGQVWEAVMFAGNNRLNNLIFIMDRNKIQIDGNTEEIMPLEPLRKKYEAFNWSVLEVNGHDMGEIIDRINLAKQSLTKPVIIIANTIPGRGVDFMENNYLWHGKAPNLKEKQKALKQL